MTQKNLVSLVLSLTNTENLIKLLQDEISGKESEIRRFTTYTFEEGKITPQEKTEFVDKLKKLREGYQEILKALLDSYDHIKPTKEPYHYGEYGNPYQKL